jgi:hypothetical protein
MSTTMASKLSVLALVALLCSDATRAWAAPTSAERETARSAMVQGDRLRTAGDYEAALACYQSAHALMHVPTTGLALAEMHAQLGHLVEARSTAIEVVNLAGAEAEPAVFAAARKSAAALTASLEPKVPSVRAAVTPEGAQYTLRIDEVEVPKQARPFPFKTNPGTHTVKIAAPGYVSQTRTVELPEGASQTLSFALVAESGSPPTAAQVAASTDAVKAAHETDGGGVVRAILGISVGGVVLATGITTGTLSWITAQDEKRHCLADGSCDPARGGALSRANTLANVANIAIPIGVVGLVYGLYELLTLRDDTTARATARVRFILTPQGALLRGAL